VVAPRVFPAAAATAACACAGVGVVPPLPQGFTGVALPDPVGEANHFTEPRVLKPDIIVFGFGAAGNEGNASSVARGGTVLRELVFCRSEDAVVGGGRAALMFVLEIDGADVLPHARGIDTPEDRELLFAADSAGNGSRLFPLAMALPQDPCLDTAERDDCAVLFFSVNTRRPLPAVLETPGRVPLGPGRPG